MTEPVTNPARLFGTFGIYRYVLACLVIVTHMGPSAYVRCGNYAVFAFYILSGYVVSFILHNHYLSAPQGLKKFALNRFLRIFPLYWIVLCCSLVLLLFFPKEAHEVLPFYNLPDDIRDWVWNITTIGMTDPLTGALNQAAIVPGSWSLGIEIIYWAMIPTLLVNAAVRRRFTRFSIAYTLFGIAVCIYIGGLAKPIQYFNALAAALPFCTGMWLFIHKQKGGWVIPRGVGIAAMLALAVLMAEAPSFYRDPYSIGFSLAFILNALIVAYLCRVDRNLLPAGVQKLDDFLGNIAYPMYLVQVPTGLSVHLLFPSLRLHDFEILGVTIAFSTAVSWLLYRTVDIPVNTIRRRIKG